MNKKYFLFMSMIFLALVIVNLQFISSAEATVCCERTTSGAWCQNAPADSCDGNYKSTPTSCESTSYCRMGTCVDVKNGVCMENSAEASCIADNSEAVWRAGSSDNIAQCQLGCCFIGDQAAFVTQTRCNSLATAYGLDVSYRTDITNEAQCISLAEPSAKGACVFQRDLERTCKFLTRSECQEIESGSESGVEVEFHEGLLCTNQDLNTNCAKTEKTMCVDFDDAVYYKDSCGNLANIYDSNRYNDLTYWDNVVKKEDSCVLNGNSESCGTCDYFLGSTCGEYRIGRDTRPAQGNNVCRSLGCEYEGENYEHGETWCGGTEGVSSVISGEVTNTDSYDENTPGSQYYRYLCYNGEVTLEACAAWRSEVCIQSSLQTGNNENPEFTTAACRVNRWQDCITQTSKTECERSDLRDCKWEEVSTWEPNGNDNPGIITSDEETGNYGACVPRYSPGYDYWAEGSDAGAACGLASVSCNKVEDRSLLGIKWLGGGDDTNLECGSIEWENELKNICVAMGDCGSSISYIGEEGYNKWSRAFNK